jgi:hypothetical protein
VLQALGKTIDSGSGSGFMAGNNLNLSSEFSGLSSRRADIACYGSDAK